MLKIACALVASVFLAAYAGRVQARGSVLASAVGARLDSDLRKGGGTDDTATLQAVLDRAADGRPVHLIVDGAALVSGLNVYGNTTLECLNGGGLYLKNNSNRAIVRNVHRSRAAITDEHITVRGCFLNGNRDHQQSAELPRVVMPWARGPSNREADGTYISGLQLLGVNSLVIADMTLWNTRAFGSLIGNASHIDIRNVIVDCGSPPGSDCPSGTDGLHFKGPLRYLSIDDVKIRVGDDALALNANDSDIDDFTVRNDFGPYVGQGPITDVTVSNVHLMDTVLGVRLLSSTERIDRVVISNVTGTIRGGYVANFSHWMNPRSLGNFGSIMVDNMNVARLSFDAAYAAQLKTYFQSVESQGTAGEQYIKEWNGGVMPVISVNGHIENLILRNIAMKVSDDRPILRIGPDSRIRSMSAELTLYDPNAQAVPLQQQPGRHVEHLNLRIELHGGSPQ